MKKYVIYFIILIIPISCMRLPEPETAGRNGIPDASYELFILNGLAETMSVFDCAGAQLYNDVLLTG